MKKTIMNIRTMAALLIASAAFTACSNEDGAVIGEQPAATQTPQVYTLTLQAANATGAQHRALELDGTKLVAKWAAGDELTVINLSSSYELLGGTLTASNVSADGQTCTFSGTLTGTIGVGNQLTLFYHATSDTQDGTLESAAANDKANANVTVASVDEGNITISESEASFNTTTAVLKLTLKDGSANALNATSLKMTVDGTDFFTASPTAATYTANGDGVLYFAVPEQFDAAAIIAQEKSGGSPTPMLIDTWMTNLNTYDVTFTATVGSDTYTATKTGYKLAAGKYYATELTMAKLTNLSSISGTEYTVQDGEVLTGTLASNVKISIAAPVAPATTTTVTLKDADINGSGTLSGDYAGITCEGNATIILEGANSVKGFDMSRPGIYVPNGNTLTIQGSGSLAATGGNGGAGIGGSMGSCGNIVIKGGNITATGSSNSAGIGGGFFVTCGDITISGGKITATGGENAAGIGGGNRGTCGAITISGGTVEATGGDCAAGIGGGRENGGCGAITITSGVTSVTATKGSYAPNSIGSGDNGTAITVTIDGTEYASGISQSPYEYSAPPALTLTNPAVGQVIGSDGNNYAADASLPTGVTAVAMIAYLGNASDCTNGLAIALADEGSLNWATAKSTCEAKTPAFTNVTWRLPSEKDWQYMFIGCGSSESYSAPIPGTSKSYSGLASKLTTAQGDALQTTYYWSSTEKDLGYDDAWYVNFDGSNAEFNDDDENYEYQVRACLAF